MSSLVRRIQRMRTRTRKGAIKRSMGAHFGDKVGVRNPRAKDLLARTEREQRRKENLS